MGSEWHYTQNRQPATSTIDTQGLKLLAEQGLLRPDDLVWQEGMPDWRPAATVVGLFPRPNAPRNESSTIVSGDGVRVDGLPVTENPSPPSLFPEAPPDWLKSTQQPEDELHPFFVWLFSILTLGCFAIWYVVRCQRRLAQGNTAIDVTGRPLGKLRHPGLVLLLGYLTLGYYSLYWISRVLEECADHLGRKDIHPRIEHGLMLCIPGYSLYLVLYRLPELVREVRRNAGLTSRSEPTLGILANPFLILALPLFCSIQQGELNTCWSRASC